MQGLRLQDRVGAASILEVAPSPRPVYAP